MLFSSLKVQIEFRLQVPGGGGELSYETDGDARRLAQGCKFRVFGLA